MGHVTKNFVRFIGDARGSTFLEYTILTGMILAVSISLTWAVGDWIGG